jgi:hypothetical protein
MRIPIPDLADLPRLSSRWLATIGIGLAIGVPAAAAHAQASDESARSNPYGLARPAQPPAWLGPHVHYRKGVGLEYRRNLKLGDTPIELGLQGPVVRKKKRVGLTFELRF